MPELPDELVERLRQILGEQPRTEAELRSLSTRAHELTGSLASDLAASEARLGKLSAEPRSSIAEAASLLRRVDELRAELDRVRSLLENLDERARTLRTAWLLNQAGTRRSSGDE